MTLFREEVAGLLPTLRALARALTGGDYALADDLVQDTMVERSRRELGISPGTNLEAWLFTILRNRFRSLRGRRHVAMEVAAEDLELWPRSRRPQEARLEVMAFRSVFPRLPRAQREMLMLVGVRGFSYEAAAAFCACERGDRQEPRPSCARRVAGDAAGRRAGHRGSWAWRSGRWPACIEAPP